MQVSFFLYILSFAVSLLSRTFFVRYLGNENLSLQGLFTNLITVISFTELGLGSASVYCLYKPIAENDFIKVKSYLSYFVKLYSYVAGASFILALCFLPFIPQMIDAELSFSTFYVDLIFILFVLNSIFSYLFIQYKLLLVADQQNYITVIITQIVHVPLVVFQIFYLAQSSDYIGFLLISIAETILVATIIATYTKKKYPHIFKAEYQLLASEEKINVKVNVVSIFYYKLGSVLLNGTNNIIISIFIRTILVGICSNYLLIIDAVNHMITQCFCGLSASIGNHTVLANRNEQEKVFRQLDVLCSIVFSLACICFGVLLNPVIRVWLGAEFVLEGPTLYAIVVTYYVAGVNTIPSLYRTSLGLFRRARYYPIVAAVVNVILSVALAKTMGLIGVFISNAVVKLLFYTMVDSRLIYKYGFDITPLRYYGKYFIRLIVLVVGFIVIQWIMSYISIPISLWQLLVYSVVCGIVTLLFYVIVYSRNEDVRLLASRLINQYIRKS